jgi:hypothetical protein
VAVVSCSGGAVRIDGIAEEGFALNHKRHFVGGGGILLGGEARRSSPAKRPRHKYHHEKPGTLVLWKSPHNRLLSQTRVFWCVTTLIRGSVSKVEMKTWMALIYKALFPSISTFETPPSLAKDQASQAESKKSQHYRGPEQD